MNTLFGIPVELSTYCPEDKLIMHPVVFHDLIVRFTDGGSTTVRKMDEPDPFRLTNLANRHPREIAKG